jgi:hypothetical protein
MDAYLYFFIIKVIFQMIYQPNNGLFINLLLTFKF